VGLLYFQSGISPLINSASAGFFYLLII
jgi:hypothetical protein